MVSISKVSSQAELDQVKVLFREYAQWLDVDLTFQGFEEELETLPAGYASPTGALFIAKVDGKLAGSVAIRAFDNTTCEMKRLFVRDQYKKQGVGRALAEAALEEARVLGYKRIVLDTLAHMRPAIKLYTSLGFQPIAAYYDNPISDAVYLTRTLEEEGLPV
ncbi:carbonic anhydrase [Chitinophaga costaii]|uniref:Carbonic anhydrase n=1 Tax=Chitinophaga costaii TaxID=1335309 RepID=A0A1C4EDI4_9BACT|nr:GNAT family N-acetyltransferase [Chitinophaga costaii]PUZ23895.1 N-acetyltransferase [Chitinophaga costaii]SCC41615.1 carbonic anhydrase [Chitinophaga costaii]